MNLLPHQTKDDLKKGLKDRSLIMASFLVAGVFIAGFILLIPSYFLSRGNYYRIEQESQNLSKKNDEVVNTMTNLSSEIKMKLEFLQSNLSTVSSADYLNEIIKFLPKEVYLNSISFSKNQLHQAKTGTVIVVSGTALSRDSLVAFSNSLRDSSLFTSVEVPVSNLTKDKNLPFSMNIFIEKLK